EKVTVGPTFTRKSKIELKNKTWETYRVLHEHGLEISITTDHPYTPVQYLNLCAGLAAREGLPVDVALRAITIHPARSLGVDDRVGSIEIGKDADLVLWSHFPLDYLAKPLMTMIDGKIIFEHAQLNLT
ncbi:MAG TPA: amidohydrolase, partial [Exiguobacterium sp.]|nr:amidohydrolase [Exiguobacterium sp.]